MFVIRRTLSALVEQIYEKRLTLERNSVTIMPVIS